MRCKSRLWLLVDVAWGLQLVRAACHNAEQSGFMLEGSWSIVYKCVQVDCFALACLSCDPAKSATSCPRRSHHVHPGLATALVAAARLGQTRSISTQLQCTPKPMLQRGMDWAHGSHQRSMSTHTSLCSPVFVHSSSAAHSHSCKQQMRTHSPSVELA